MISPTDIFLLGAFFGSTACSLSVIFYYMAELVWGSREQQLSKEQSK